MPSYKSDLERLAKAEFDEDEWKWKRSLQRAIREGDLYLIEERVKEGIDFGYSFSDFDNPTVAAIWRRFS